MRVKKIVTAASSVLVISALMATPVWDAPAVSADNYMALPGGHSFKRLLDGSTVDLTLSREHALVSPPMVGVFTSRNVWASGVYHVKAPTAKKTTLLAGYLLACSIRYNSGNYSWNGGRIFAGGDDVNSTVNYDASADNPIGFYPAIGIDFGNHQGQLTITPGNTKFVPVLSADAPTLDIPGEGGVTYDDTEFNVDDCVGYASARALANLEVQTSQVKANVTLWGKPFSIS